jgi:hypothetical protein
MSSIPVASWQKNFGERFTLLTAFEAKKRSTSDWLGRLKRHRYPLARTSFRTRPFPPWLFLFRCCDEIENPLSATLLLPRPAPRDNRHTGWVGLLHVAELRSANPAFLRHYFRQQETHMKATTGASNEKSGIYFQWFMKIQTKYFLYVKCRISIKAKVVESLVRRGVVTLSLSHRLLPIPLVETLTGNDY